MAEPMFDRNVYRVCPVCGQNAVICARLCYDHGNEIEEVWERVNCGTCRQIRQCAPLYLTRDGRPV